jgi:hypothetical protein
MHGFANYVIVQLNCIQGMKSFFITCVLVNQHSPPGGHPCACRHGGWANRRLPPASSFCSPHDAGLPASMFAIICRQCASHASPLVCWPIRQKRPLATRSAASRRGDCSTDPCPSGHTLSSLTNAATRSGSTSPNPSRKRTFQGSPSSKRPAHLSAQKQHKPHTFLTCPRSSRPRCQRSNTPRCR